MINAFEGFFSSIKSEHMLLVCYLCCKSCHHRWQQLLI